MNLLDNLICKEEIELSLKKFKDVWSEFLIGAQKTRKTNDKDEIIYEIQNENLYSYLQIIINGSDAF